MKLLKKTFSVLAMSILLLVAPFAGQADASTKSTNITKTATSLTGIKYRYGGTTKAGFDCSGYVGYVFNQNGLKVARTSSGLYASGKPVKKSNLTSGDLVFFNTSGKGVSHVGIYVGNGKFAHASTSKGVRVDKLNDPYYWGKRYVGAKRIAGVHQVAAK
ncbi:C40 family peptidase [Mammaliicoccus sciuri]|uniref:Cell wall-associated hydrolase, NlpC family n=2 Tax=Sporosarcina newyorkensis TaxID=759851 RepID=A0A1T4Y1T8_9BACL|nr:MULTISPECIES: C40 family peptidase [Sporosarcina]EGQ26990.1 endopeptidase [Sporosarcina newyorkensis 2681]MBY0222627.1 C40 family peptidase [Sporosarcina aquimarina]SKA95448.1 Cell wall-associated hydrolase, NlpC family [Sporosarcina newyorkensis]